MFKAMSQFRVSTRIFTGFSVLLLVIAGFASALWWSGRESARSLSAITFGAELTVRSTAADADLQTMRRLVTAFFYTNDLSHVDPVRRQAAVVRQHFDNLILDTQDPYVQDQLRQAVKQIASYLESFEKRAALTEERNKMVQETIDRFGPDTLSLLNKIRADAEVAGQASVAFRAAEISEKFTAARFAARGFLVDDRQDPVMTVIPALDEALAGAASLRQQLARVGKADVGARLVGLITGYRASFSRVAEISLYNRDVIQPQMAERGAALVRMAEDIRIAGVRGFHEQSTAALDVLASTRTTASIIAVFVLLAGILFASVVALGISHPLKSITAAIRRLAERDVTVAIPALDYKDEIGEIAAALEVFRHNMIQNEALQAERQADAEARAARGVRLGELMQIFDRDVGTLLQTVASATDELNATAQSMSAIAEETSSQALSVAQSSEQVSTNVQMVASASEQLGASIQEISRQVHESSELSRSAMMRAHDATHAVLGLKSTAVEIGAVVNLITDIAGQTNMLALNATIEAARAGEYGKGFAVVASEVKDLASQTARATEEIRQRIDAIQTAVGNAADAIEMIVSSVDEATNAAAAIASAVEEQSAATRDISANVSQAATVTTAVTSTISGVSDAAQETGAASGKVLNASQTLTEDARQLRSLVERFLANVRAA